MEFDSFLVSVAASTIAATLVLIIVRLRARSARLSEKRNSRPKKKAKLVRWCKCCAAVVLDEYVDGHLAGKKHMKLAKGRDDDPWRQVTPAWAAEAAARA